MTILCVPLNLFVIKNQRATQKSLSAARDKKTKGITEALFALRQIKFSASEFQWTEHIEDLRKEEIKNLRMKFAANVRSKDKILY